MLRQLKALGAELTAIFNPHHHRDHVGGNQTLIEHFPFGGVKQTGNGHREAGTAALDVFTEWKTVYVDFSGRL